MQSRVGLVCQTFQLRCVVKNKCADAVAVNDGEISHKT